MKKIREVKTKEESRRRRRKRKRRNIKKRGTEEEDQEEGEQEGKEEEKKKRIKRKVKDGGYMEKERDRERPVERGNFCLQKEFLPHSFFSSSLP